MHFVRGKGMHCKLNLEPNTQMHHKLLLFAAGCKDDKARTRQGTI